MQTVFQQHSLEIDGACSWHEVENLRHRESNLNCQKTSEKWVDQRWYGACRAETEIRDHADDRHMPLSVRAIQGHCTLPKVEPLYLYLSLMPKMFSYGVCPCCLSLEPSVSAAPVCACARCGRVHLCLCLCLFVCAPLRLYLVISRAVCARALVSGPESR